MKQTEITRDIVGINLLGAPYIPLVKEKIAQIRKQFGEELKIVLGGQVMTTRRGLSNEQFRKLFGTNVFNGMQP